MARGALGSHLSTWNRFVALNIFYHTCRIKPSWHDRLGVGVCHHSAIVSDRSARRHGYPDFSTQALGCPRRRLAVIDCIQTRLEIQRKQVICRPVSSRVLRAYAKRASSLLLVRKVYLACCMRIRVIYEVWCMPGQRLMTILTHCVVPYMLLLALHNTALPRRHWHDVKC